MKKGKIFIISGPSGSGNTTLYTKILSDKKLKKYLKRSVSVTTRSRRKGEKNGRDYFFVSKKMFDYKKNAGHFFEWEKVFDNYYGTTKTEVRNIQLAGKNVLLCIDVKGALAVKKKIKDAVTIFVKTSSLKVLKQRLELRGTENKKVLDLRLETAKRELKEEKKYQYIIVNEKLERAYFDLEKIIFSEIKSI